MMKRSPFLIIFLIITGCSTTVEFVRKDVSPMKQAIVRWLPASEEREAKYRENLIQRATEYCGGPFQITKEYQALSESPTSAGFGTGIGFGSGSSVFLGSSAPNTTMYNFVEFTCTTVP